jgi:hypothetical protein
LALLLALVIPFASCRETSGPGGRTPELGSLEVVSAPAPTGTVGAALADSVVVRALDTGGNPMEGVAITWTADGWPHIQTVNGGWGGSVTGLSSLNGADASENETTQYEKLDPNKWYAVRIRVADGKIECWLNEKQMVDVELKDNRISTRIEVDPNKPLGVCCYNTESGLKEIKLRRLPAEK